MERRDRGQFDPRLHFYTLAEVAEICRVPVASVKYWKSTGRLRAIKIGKHPLVSHGELLRITGTGEDENTPFTH